MILITSFWSILQRELRRIIHSTRLTMEIHSLQDIENSLSETRREFNRTTAPIRSLLDDTVSLYFEARDLIGTVAKNTDEERHVLEVLAVSFRRIMASFVLLESGLLREAQMVLRNAFEWWFIAMDITYDKESLEAWKKTSEEDLMNANRKEWRFKPSLIHKRIEKNEGKIYPEHIRRLSQHTYKEYDKLSREAVHAHSRTQIITLFDSRGTMTFLERKTVENYKIDFKLFQSLIYNLTTLWIDIPRYRDLLFEPKNITARTKRFLDRYAKLQKQIGVTLEMVEAIKKIRLLDSDDKEIEIPVELGKALTELGAKAIVVGEAGGDFGVIIQQMLNLLVSNNFEITKLKAIVTYTQTEAGAKIDGITLYYVG